MSNIETLKQKIISLRFNLANARRDADAYPDLEDEVADHETALQQATDKLIKLESGEKMEIDPREAKLFELQTKYDDWSGRLLQAYELKADAAIINKLKAAIAKKATEIAAAEDELAGVDRKTADDESKRIDAEVAALRIEALAISKQIEAKIARQRQLAPRKPKDDRSDKEKLDDNVSDRREDYKRQYGVAPGEFVSGHVRTRAPGSDIWT